MIRSNTNPDTKPLEIELHCGVWLCLLSCSIKVGLFGGKLDPQEYILNTNTQIQHKYTKMRPQEI